MSKKGQSTRTKVARTPAAVAVAPVPAADAPPAGDGSERIAKGDYEALVRLFAAASPLTMSHWNPTTGEMFSLPPGRAERREAAERFEDRLFEEPGWFEVPYLESDEAFGLLGSFAASLDAGRGKTAVMQAIEGPKPFRALRQVLVGAPGLERRYRRFLEAEAELRLATFCASLDLELADPRFAIALGHAAETWGEDETAEAPPPVSDHRPVGALSIGKRPRGEGT